MKAATFTDRVSMLSLLIKIWKLIRIMEVSHIYKNLYFLSFPKGDDAVSHRRARGTDGVRTKRSGVWQSPRPMGDRRVTKIAPRDDKK